MISISIITESDDPRLVQIEKLFLEFYQYMKEKGISTGLPKGGEKVWMASINKTLKRFTRLVVASEGDTIIGFGHGMIRYAPDYLGGQKIGFVAHFFVSPKARTNGTGRKIAEELDAWFKELNVRSIELQVIENNETGMNFWKALGFKNDMMQLKKVCS